MNLFKHFKRNKILFIQFIVCSIYCLFFISEVREVCYFDRDCYTGFILMMIFCSYTPIIITILLKYIIPLKYAYVAYILSFLATLGLWYLGIFLYVITIASGI